MSENPYQHLARRLDELPNGFPPTPDGLELRLLAHLYTPEEADLASRLRLTLETPDQVAERIGADPAELRSRLKSMTRRGLIAAGRTETGLGYGLLPFVVGIYEMQVASLDAEMARLFEDYYRQAFGQILSVQPAVHRVIPIGESVKTGIEIQPYESAAEIVRSAQAWGVLDCICRKQKALIGEPCGHPVDICMAFSQQPGAFDQSQVVHALSLSEALDTLARAAKAGLVHSVSNSLHGLGYICNCCTCSCGVLRGIAEMGILNAIAYSPFINTVDADLCTACESCLDGCQFNALHLELVMTVDPLRCVGCGVCVPLCTESALSLVRRPESPAEKIPATLDDWRAQRAAARHIDLSNVL
jgi:Pyruvate/2-oxoacid:ferredoxin oxidoreductase delta subunit